jgi:diguanylate cyclase (GGDEF)-like protein
MNSSSLSNKVSLSLTGVFILLVILISSLGLERLEQQTKANVRESLQTVLRTNHEALYIWSNFRLKELLALSGKKELVDLTTRLLAEYNQDTESKETLTSIRTYLLPVIKENDDKGFFIISKNRTNVASMRDVNIGMTNLIHLQRKKFMDRVFEGKAVFISTIQSDVHLETHTGNQDGKIPTGFFVAPIRDASEIIIAALAFRYDPSHEFTRIAQLSRMGETGETYAFDKQGVLISESRFDHHLQRIGMIRPNEKAILSIRISDPGVNMVKGLTPEMSEADRPLTLMAKSATAGMTDNNVDGYRDYRGVPVMGAWLWDKELGFGLTTEIDVEEAMQPYYETRNALIIIITATLTLSLILLTLILRLQRESSRKLSFAHSQLEKRVIERTRQLEDAQNNLSQINEELELLSITDDLTGVSNRRNFDKHTEHEWRHCYREEISMTIIMIDIDYFKKYNDTYGHQMGDDCLKAIAQLLNDIEFANRPGDLLARYGGEEFIILLVNANAEYVDEFTRLILEKVAELRIPHAATEVSNYEYVSLSLGYARADSIKNITYKELVKHADEALYRAKDAGRNKVCSN